MRPAQSSQILPTRQLVGKPGPKFLIRPRIVTPTDRTPTVSHVHTLLHSSGYAGCRFDKQVGGLDAATTLSLVSRAHRQVLEQECALVELAAHWADCTIPTAKRRLRSHCRVRSGTSAGWGRHPGGVGVRRRRVGCPDADHARVGAGVDG